MTTKLVTNAHAASFRWAKACPRILPTKMRDPTMFCIHVVPHFDGVEMTMSSSRNRNRSQRALSAKNP